MPIPVDIVARLDGKALDGVSSAVKRSMSDAGTTASGEFNKGFSKGINQTVSNFTSQFGVMGTAANNVFSGITSKATPAALGVAGIGLAAVAVGKQLYDLGADWDKVTDSMVARTGRVGQELQVLKDGLKDVASDTAAPIAELGDIFSRVAQSMHLTGDPLKLMVKNIADFNEMTGEKLGVRELSKAFRLFGVDIQKDGVKQLNSLADASQATGIPLNELIQTLTSKGAVAAKQFNLDIGETAALLTTFEAGGLPLTESINGLAIALKQVPDQAALGARITEIKRLVDIGDSEGANKLAAKTFGRGFVDFLNAIGTGAIDAQSLNTALSNVGSTIEEERQATKDWTEEWQIMINTLKTQLEPVASSVFSQINQALLDTTTTIKEEAEIWKETWRNVRFAWDDLWGDAALPPGQLAPGASGSTLPGGGGVNAGGIPIPGQTPGESTIGGIPIPGLTRQPGGGGGGGVAPGGAGIGGPTVGGGRGFGAGSITDQMITGLGGNVSNLPSPAAMAAIAKAQALNGLPYTPGSTDCSGYISQVYSAMTGTQTHFSTETFNGPALGWHRGIMPGALNIGIKHGGPGGGHMAGTLPNGVNIESGGSSGGVSYGSGPGAQGGQFTEQWWFMPGYAKGGATDTVHAMLTPGEHVLTTDDVDAMGGQSGVYGFRNALHRNGGGQVNWWGRTADTMDLNEEFKRMLMQFGLVKSGVPIGPANFNPKAKLDTSTFQYTPPTGRDASSYNFRDVIDLGTVSPEEMANPRWRATSVNHPGMDATQDWLIQRSQQTRKGFQTGGGVFDPNSQSDMTDSFLSGMQQGGGYGGMIASFIQMGMAGQQKPGQRQPGIGNGPPPVSSGIGTGPLPGPPPIQGFAPASVGGTGMGGVSAVDMAGGAAAMAADAFAPGSGEAVKMGTKLANRAIAFGGQALSIGIQAIPETFLLHGSALGDPSRNWLGKIASGIGGGRPPQDNTAGQSSPAMPMQQPAGSPASGQGSGPAPGPAFGQVNFQSVQDPQTMLRDLDRLYSSKMNAHGAGQGP